MNKWLWMPSWLIIVTFYSSLAHGQANSRPPNIVFILADDLGWHQLGCYGSEYYETPVLDSFARQCLKLTNAYSAAPVCSPTRASILTGKYPARLHLTNFLETGKPSRSDPKPWLEPNLKIPIRSATVRDGVVFPAWATHLPLEEVTIAENLSSVGYVTGHFGKWHLNFDKAYQPGRPGDPQSQGFDTVLTTHKARLGPSSHLENDPLHVNQITEHTLAFIETNKARPFFAYVSHNSIHNPEIADDHLISRFAAKKNSGSVESKNYDHNNPRQAAMLFELDRSIGRILNKLKELELDSNTLVVFTSDNGHLGSKNNKPLRGSKADLYEGGIRVPLLIRWPNKIVGGNVCDTPVISNDFFATFSEVAGVAKLPSNLDGLSLVPLFDDPTKNLTRDSLYFHFPHDHGSGLGPMAAIRTGNYKLIEFSKLLLDGNRDAYELYDLDTDPSETRNLALERPELVQLLGKELAVWREEVDAQTIRKKSE